jgi:hypothetical protein
MKKIKKDLGKAVESLKSVVKKATSQVKKITRRTQHVDLNSDIIKHKSAAGKFFKNLNNNVWNNVTNNRITQFYQFHGCFWHGCPHCYELEQFTPHRVHKGTDIPMKFGDLYAYTQHMTERYKAAGYQVKEGNVNGMNLPR